MLFRSSLPTAVDVPEHELDGPVPPIEAVLFDFANTLFLHYRWRGKLAGEENELVAYRIHRIGHHGQAHVPEPAQGGA